MDVIYRLQSVEFERDENKAKSNVVKHGVTFEEAAETFFDPFRDTSYQALIKFYMGQVLRQDLSRLFEEHVN